MAIMQEMLERIHEYGAYGYTPALTPAVIMTSVYFVCAIGHIFLAFYTRQKMWLVTLALGSVAETAANGLRIYGHFFPKGEASVSAYIAQQTLSVLTPAFFAAAHFSILGLCLVMFGQEYSLVSPHLIVPFFVGVDIVSLIAQGTGSGMAAVAEQALPPQSTIPGAWIVVGGLASQLVGYLLFNILFVNFVVKAVRNPPQHPLWSSKMKLFLVMVWISSLLVFARSVFRTIELTMGWIGPIATTEWCFYAFDAAPVSLAVLILLPFHPGFFMPSGLNLFKKGASGPTIDEQVEEKRKSRWSSYPTGDWRQFQSPTLQFGVRRDVESGMLPQNEWVQHFKSGDGGYTLAAQLYSSASSIVSTEKFYDADSTRQASPVAREPATPPAAQYAFANTRSRGSNLASPQRSHPPRALPKRYQSHESDAQQDAPAPSARRPSQERSRSSDRSSRTSERSSSRQRSQDGRSAEPTRPKFERQSSSQSQRTHGRQRSSVSKWASRYDAPASASGDHDEAYGGTRTSTTSYRGTAF